MSHIHTYVTGETSRAGLRSYAEDVISLISKIEELSQRYSSRFTKGLSHEDWQDYVARLLPIEAKLKRR
jgi:hypothetical protein